MTKHVQKIIAVISTVILSFQFSIMPIHALETKLSSVIIPEQMQPNTIIEYISATEYRVIQGGECTVKIVDTGIPERAKNDLAKRGITDIGSINIIKASPVKPAKGIMVYYADDGQILRIEMPFVEKMQTRANCASCGSSFVSGAATSGDNYMWGGTYGNNNFLWSDSSSVYGYGRFTNFTDTIGQGNHTLFKGDVATRGHVDNPPTGKILRCEAPQKGSGVNKQVNMRKWDIGCMPNAVLDIWKTGVEYWGYTWSSSLSINDGYYEYDR